MLSDASNPNDKSTESDAPTPPNPKRGGFFDFFRTYVNGWVAAAVVLPTAITWKGMPAYESQRPILTSFTTLSCVLILAYLFYSREHLLAIAKLKSRMGRVGSLLVPLLLIGGTAFCGFKYIGLLTDSARYAQMHLDKAVETRQLDEIREGTAMMVYYILTMVLAECALFFMAIREWRR